MMPRVVCGFIVAALLSSAVAAFVAAQQPQKSAYDPGIRPETPESIRAEKAAEETWFAHLQVLASDTLKGRKTGTPEFLEAADYVEAQFKAAGLKPAGVDGFRQPVGFRRVSIDGRALSLELVHGDASIQPLKVGSDVTLSPNAEGALSIEAPAVFAGYGLVVPSLGIDDLKGLDLHGKIAVIFGGAPQAVHGPLKAYFRTAAIRWQALKAAGAVGLITIVEPRRVPGGLPSPDAARPVDQLADPALNPLAGCARQCYSAACIRWWFICWGCAYAR